MLVDASELATLCPAPARKSFAASTGHQARCLRRLCFAIGATNAVGQAACGCHANRAPPTNSQKKRGPAPAGAGTGLVVALRSGLVGPAVTNSALSSEAGGGRLRRPAGLAQVKTTSLAIELKSIKDHLLPTKVLVTQPRLPKDRLPLPSSPSRRVSTTRRLHYSRTVQVSYTRITRKKSDSGKTRRAGAGFGEGSMEHGAGRGRETVMALAADAARRFTNTNAEP